MATTSLNIRFWDGIHIIYKDQNILKYCENGSCEEYDKFYHILNWCDLSFWSVAIDRALEFCKMSKSIGNKKKENLMDFALQLHFFPQRFGFVVVVCFVFSLKQIYEKKKPTQFLKRHFIQINIIEILLSDLLDCLYALKRNMQVCQAE